MPTIEPPDERGLALLKVIIARIRSGEIRKGDPETFLTASEAMILLGKPGPWTHVGLALKHNGLASLERWTARHDEVPKVGALIVYKNAHTPREPFMEANGKGYNPEGLAWWMKEADRAIGFDWSPWLPTEVYGQLSEYLKGLLGTREEPPAHWIDVQTIPERLQNRGLSVSAVLRCFAEGRSEDEIIRRYPGLYRDDIRATLAYAASREDKSRLADTGESTLSAIARRWQGKINLRKSYPDDPRMDYLVKKYWRNRE